MNKMMKIACRKKWNDLDFISELESDDIRNCQDCNSQVYKCYSVDEIILMGIQGKCVAITSHFSDFPIGVGLPNIENLIKK